MGCGRGGGGVHDALRVLVLVIERPPPKVAPVGMTPGGVLLRENRMYGCENSVHKETPCAAHSRVSKYR